MEILWVGPIKISGLLANCLNPTAPFPPAHGSAYLVTQHPWRNRPTKASVPLYVGGNTGQSERFSTRIGDLVADSVGLFTATRGHHSGGRSIRAWTLDNNVSPLDLYLAWVAPKHCHRCLEVELVAQLDPLLNKRSPPACTWHTTGIR